MSASFQDRLMYGKFFSSTFTGSMFGAGADVFAVWGYVIANTRDGHVELNPQLLAAVIGSTTEEIEAAIAYLCCPDPESRSPSEDGRRLVLDGRFQYVVVNHATYRAIRNEDDRKAYNRAAQQRSRARRVKPSVNDSQSLSSVSAQSEAEAEAETKEQIPALENALTARFARFWAVYPNKKGKGAARKAWEKRHPSETLTDLIVAAVQRQCSWPEWVKDGGQFIPHPATWLNRESWDDESYAETMTSYERPLEKSPLAIINEARAAAGRPLLKG